MLTILIAIALHLRASTNAAPHIAEDADATFEAFGETAPYVDEYPLGDPTVWDCFTEPASGSAAECEAQVSDSYALDYCDGESDCDDCDDGCGDVGPEDPAWDGRFSDCRPW